MKVYGHRGALTLAPENTLESYKKAFESGCHGIELDVHLTADGEVAVIHNFNTEQACGKHLVIRESTMAQLKELDVVYDFGDKFKGLKIPTLEEVYEFMKDYPEKDVIVETKGDEIGAPLLERVVEITKKYRMTHRVIFSTARDSTFKWFNEKHPDLPVSMLPQTYDDADISNALSCAGCVAVSPYFGAVDDSFVKKSHDNNFNVVPWTVNDNDTLKRLVALGVDGVITNCPALIMEELNK
ncbi:MAG: hypothetical protein E7588_00920 [Ruminococcaceae bacterium]|nr:hypothetical protein [Oscillospiraceae bacterium]